MVIIRYPLLLSSIGEKSENKVQFREIALLFLGSEHYSYANLESFQVVNEYIWHPQVIDEI